MLGNRINFEEFLGSTWSSEASWSANVVKFREEIEVWNTKVFGHVGCQKRRLRAWLRGIDRALMRRHSVFLTGLATELKMELETIMD
ncbi:hypothetical protein V6N13_113642 [Hibiscus sabdariffa]